jgi:hypothetical protein
MATYRPDARWEPGGTTFFAPNGGIGGWQPILEGTPVNSTACYSTVTVSSNGTQYLQYTDYPGGLAQQQQAQQQLHNHLMDALRYGHATYRTPFWEEAPKALATKALSAADRAELEERLSF